MRHITLFMVFTILSAFLCAQLIKNPDKPLKGNWDFQMKKIWEIEEAGSDVIGEVQNLRTAKDGRVYIADSKHCKIFIFSKEGKFISFFGKKGEGPGEIKHYSSGDQLSVLDDTIIFSEWGRIQYFSLDGKYKKTAVVPPNVKAGTFISEDEFMSAPRAIRGYRLKKKKAKLILYNLKDQSEKIITEFYPYDKATARTESARGRASVSVFIHSITPMVFVTYRDGKIYYGMSDSYNINVIDLKGTEICSFSVDGRKQKEVTDKFKKDLAKSLGDVPADLVKKIIDGLPEKASFFQEIKVDKNGLIYVLVSDPGNETSQAIDIFSPQGKYLYSSELRVEEGLIINGIFLIEDNVFLAEEDEEGNLKVAKYLINLPVL